MKYTMKEYIAKHLSMPYFDDKLDEWCVNYVVNTLWKTQKTRKMAFSSQEKAYSFYFSKEKEYKYLFTMTNWRAKKFSKER